MVECGGLENRCTARYRGFESLRLCRVKGRHQKCWPFLFCRLEFERKERFEIEYNENHEGWCGMPEGMSKSLRFTLLKKVLEYSVCIDLIKREKWSHQESNLDLEFRKLLFYPLNYETKSIGYRQP